MNAASVIVCAHEPAGLRRTLAALQAQSLPASDWELLLVERAGNRKPAGYDLAWHAGARTFLEETANFAPLLRRAIAEHKSDLLIILDQNCDPAPDYLSEAVQISRQWPRVGAWGSGAIDLELQASPSQPLRDLASQVARRSVDNRLYSNVLTCVEAMPLGPGLCVRAALATAYHNRPARAITGTTDEAFFLDLVAAELGYLACSMGLGMGIFPQLKLTRVIPGSAGERQFLKYRERESILRKLLNLEWKGIRPADPLSPGALVSTARTILLENGVRRRLQIADFKASIKARKMLKTGSLGHTR